MSERQAHNVYDGRGRGTWVRGGLRLCFMHSTSSQRRMLLGAWMEVVSLVTACSVCHGVLCVVCDEEGSSGSLLLIMLDVGCWLLFLYR